MCCVQFHPDKNRDPRASDAFVAIGSAFECLSDPRQRALYDARQQSSSRGLGRPASGSGASESARAAAAQRRGSGAAAPATGARGGGSSSSWARSFHSHYSSGAGSSARGNRASHRAAPRGTGRPAASGRPGGMFGAASPRKSAAQKPTRRTTARVDATRGAEPGPSANATGRRQGRPSAGSEWHGVRGYASFTSPRAGGGASASASAATRHSGGPFEDMESLLARLKMRFDAEMAASRAADEEAKRGR